MDRENSIIAPCGQVGGSYYYNFDTSIIYSSACQTGLPVTVNRVLLHTLG